MFNCGQGKGVKQTYWCFWPTCIWLIYESFLKLEAKKIFCLAIEDMSASQNVNPGHPHFKATMYKGATIVWHCKEALFWERDPSALSLCPLILSNELPMCVILFGWCNCFWAICTLVYILSEKVVFGALKNINCWYGEFHSWKIVSGKKTCLGNTFKGDAGESNNESNESIESNVSNESNESNELRLSKT